MAESNGITQLSDDDLAGRIRELMAEMGPLEASLGRLRVEVQRLASGRREEDRPAEAALTDLSPAVHPDQRRVRKVSLQGRRAVIDHEPQGQRPAVVAQDALAGTGGAGIDLEGERIPGRFLAEGQLWPHGDDRAGPHVERKRGQVGPAHDPATTLEL